MHRFRVCPIPEEVVAVPSSERKAVGEPILHDFRRLGPTAAVSSRRVTDDGEGAKATRFRSGATTFGQTPALWDRWSIGCSNGGRPVQIARKFSISAGGLLRADERIQQDDLPAILQTAVDRYQALIARPDVCTLFSRGTGGTKCR